MTRPADRLTRHVSFDDPAEIAAGVSGRHGMEFLQHLIDADVRVPIAEVLGYRLVEVGEGLAVFEGEAGPWSFNPIGGVQGGWYASILDAALGVCLHTTLPAGVGYTTIEFKLNIVKAITPATGPVRATGRILHRGRRTAVTEARLEDARGTLHAHATATQLVLEPRGA
ncbi:MAG: PaaI family thioesterase [Gemmatimonadaceae bacterium]|nr:PaaI family thioesterase [Gemmatimonadaceae bacterium]